jgi:phosphopantothenoylcysteine decarboxylase/phosphopantothenate--cysteine ligase
LLGPDAGPQACGEIGMGRMLEAQQLLESMIAFFTPKLLAGKRVLLTAGPTFEPIDPVRGITNLSSGKMGYALARAALYAGADVTLISGPVALTAPDGVHCIAVQTAREMHSAVMSHIAGQQVFIAVAAVADWHIVNTSAQKLKKQNDGTSPALAFGLNPDILAEVAALPKRPFCVGFAAESENLLAYAEEKRRRKNIPLLVGNIAHAAFGQDSNTLTLFDERGHTELPRADKQELATLLIAEIAHRL